MLHLCLCLSLSEIYTHTHTHTYTHIENLSRLRNAVAVRLLGTIKAALQEYRRLMIATDFSPLPSLLSLLSPLSPSPFLSLSLHLSATPSLLCL